MSLSNISALIAKPIIQTSNSLKLSENSKNAQLEYVTILNIADPNTFMFSIDNGDGHKLCQFWLMANIRKLVIKLLQPR